MKDVRPKIKQLIRNFPVPAWDPNRHCIDLPRGNAPDIPFCHYTPLKTFFHRGNKFEVLDFKYDYSGTHLEPILRITIDGVMYHVATCSQWGEELLYEIFFCKCSDLPNEMELQYTVKEPHEIFDISVTGTVEIHHEYRSDHQKHLDTKDSDVIEFFQNLINLCRDFYLANKAELDSML